MSTPAWLGLGGVPVLPCEPGLPWPLGASCQHEAGQAGVNFAVASRHAQRVEVCLFDASGRRETARVLLRGPSQGVWHGFVPGLTAGQLYGLRAHGPYQPRSGQRFNPAKLLIDPFARELVGDTAQLALEFDYLGTPPADASVLDAAPDPHDNAARVPKARVLDWARECQAGAAIAPAPRHSEAQLVLYEAHVKGLTRRHPDVPAALRGSYAGLVSAPMLAHFQRLGVTTLCLLPVHQHITEAHLLKKGLRNYWGYNTLGFFVPEPGYASAEFADARTEFRHMVDQLHRAGLELVLDVVFNHSAESDTFGPTLSWRGLDNALWYALDGAGQYLNFSGCGNSLDLSQSAGVQLVMDCLRWWVQAFGVDGFRFDLATALGREPGRHASFNPLSGLLSAIAQDPVLAGVRLIAEPWDVGPDGYQLGRFPLRWQEWNDRFRDGSRAFWLGFDCTRGEFARRFCGSSDVFGSGGRGPLASINLISAHDGMTLADLTAYSQRHNHANGEDNRDGHAHELCAHGGIEGPTGDEAVQAVRGRWRRALLASLFCAQGTPQLLAGDEIGQSQGGNNNAYCQDNETSWLDWARADPALTDFVAGLIHLRQAHAALRHARWFRGDGDIRWRRPDGADMSPSDWEQRQERSFGCLIEPTEATSRERWLLLFHPGAEALRFALPSGAWRLVLDSAAALALPQARWDQAQCCSEACVVPARALQGWVQTSLSIQEEP